MVLGTLAEWTQVELEEGVDEGGRTIDLIVWTGEKEELVNITDEELNSLRDVEGEIRFEMTKKVVEDGWKLKFYQDDTIQPDHVVRFYGTLLAKMLTDS